MAIQQQQKTFKIRVAKTLVGYGIIGYLYQILQLVKTMAKQQFKFKLILTLEFESNDEDEVDYILEHISDDTYKVKFLKSEGDFEHYSIKANSVVGKCTELVTVHKPLDLPEMPVQQKNILQRVLRR